MHEYMEHLHKFAYSDPIFIMYFHIVARWCFDSNLQFD